MPSTATISLIIQTTVERCTPIWSTHALKPSVLRFSYLTGLGVHLLHIKYIVAKLNHNAESQAFFMPLR
jgi:hypothetical protein